MPIRTMIQPRGDRGLLPQTDEALRPLSKPGQEGETPPWFSVSHPLSSSCLRVLWRDASYRAVGAWFLPPCPPVAHFPSRASVAIRANRARAAV